MNKSKLVLILTVAGLMVASSVFAQRGMRWRSDAWGPGGQYGKMYDVKTVETMSGEVEAVERFTARKGVADGIHLILKTEQEKISVHLGPAWFIENQSAKIKSGDQIELTGSRIDYEGKPAIIAAEINLGEEALVLRSADGFPAWSGWRGPGMRRGRWQNRGCFGMGPGRGQFGSPNYDVNSVITVTGMVEKVEKRPGKAGSFFGVHLMLKTEKESFDVHLGPEWFVEDGESKFLINDKVKVTGSRIMYKGRPAIIAKEIVKGDDVLKLRDDRGFPSWRGWRRR